MRALPSEIMSETTESPAEISEETLGFYVNSFFNALEEKRQAVAKFEEIYAVGLPFFLKRDPESISDPELMDKLIEIQLMYRGPGGA